MVRRSNFRPTVQNLEPRRLMAADGFEINGSINRDDAGADGTSNTLMVGEMYAGTPSRDTVTDDVIVDGNIITAENYDSAGYPSFTGGVRVAAGDVTGEEVGNVITAPGPGGGPHVDDATDAVFSELGSGASPSPTGGIFDPIVTVRDDESAMAID